MMRILFLFPVLLTGLISVRHPSPRDTITNGQRIPVYTDTLNSTHELVGPLGKPLGEVVTLTAKVEAKHLKGAFEDYVTVTDVNGTALQEPKKLPVRRWPWANTKELKVGQQLHLRAYQDGGMIGTPLQAMKETVFVQTQDYIFMTWLVVINEVKYKE
jgi:hypothetical protein